MIVLYKKVSINLRSMLTLSRINLELRNQPESQNSNIIISDVAITIIVVKKIYLMVNMMCKSFQLPSI